MGVLRGWCGTCGCMTLPAAPEARRFEVLVQPGPFSAWPSRLVELEGDALLLFFVRSPGGGGLSAPPGVIRHESYFLAGGPDVQWLSMSVAKSFISALIGIAASVDAQLTAPLQVIRPCNGGLVVTARRAPSARVRAS